MPGKQLGSQFDSHRLLPLVLKISSSPTAAHGMSTGVTLFISVVCCGDMKANRTVPGCQSDSIVGQPSVSPVNSCPPDKTTQLKPGFV